MIALIDLDGTLCDPSGRKHLAPDWERYSAACGDDPPIEMGISVAWGLSEHYEIWCVTGRNESAHKPTISWLAKHLEIYTKLFMRPHGDSRPNPKLKQEWAQMAVILQAHSGKDSPVVGVDDHPGVIEVYTKLGIPCMQVHGPQKDTGAMIQDAEEWRRW